MVVLAGIVVGQALLYGPSLTGRKILLPLDILAQPSVYLPRTEPWSKVVPHDPVLSDLVFFMEPERRFAHDQIMAGHFPLWTSHRYAGAPSYRLSFSPPWLLAYLIASPVVLAWTQLIIAVIAGMGAYCFFRKVLRVSFWPAALAAWCYPLTGAFIIWQGFWLPAVMCWLPWILLAVDRAVRRPLGWGGPSLAALSALALVSGAADIAGQVLLASGIFAIGCYFHEYGLHRPTRRAVAGAGITSAGWLLGILAALWLLFPMIQYVGTGARSVARADGREERPPVGISALPQVVLPDMYGSTRHGSLRIVHGNVPESSVGAYAGLLAALVAAPLAWRSRGQRWFLITGIGMIILALGWSLNIPGITHLLRLRGLNMMSHNRFVFVAGFVTLAIAAIGLDVLHQGTLRRRWWFIVPPGILMGIFVWCAWRSFSLPEPIASELGAVIRAGGSIPGVATMGEVLEVKRAFVTSAAVSALLAAAGLVMWAWRWASPLAGPLATTVLGAMMLSELLWFGHGRAAQCDWGLYYPRIALLEQIARSSTGRVIGFECLPPNLSQTHGLRDVRGYDGVDPARLVDLLGAASQANTPKLPYAVTQWLVPKAAAAGDGTVRLSPILDMLGVAHVIFRGTPPAGAAPKLVGDDYWVLTNPRAMPRVFVPRRVEIVPDSNQRLARLSSARFDPRDVAYVEQPVNCSAKVGGRAAIKQESPTSLVLEADVAGTGLLVLADNWDAGWNAYVNGKRSPVLRVNHALRGVVVTGPASVEFRYEPASLRRGVALSLIAGACWLSWVGAIAACGFVKLHASEGTPMSSRAMPRPARDMRWRLGTPMYGVGNNAREQL